MRNVTQLNRTTALLFSLFLQMNLRFLKRTIYILQPKLPPIISKLINKDSIGCTRALPGSNQSSVAGAILSR